MKLAVVTSIHPDFDKRVWRYATSLADHGNVVHLISPWKISGEENYSGIFFHPFNRKTGLLSRFFIIPFYTGRKLFPVLKNISLVHFHDIDLLPLMALISFYRPVVYDVHENYGDEVMRRAPFPVPVSKLLKHFVMKLQFALSIWIRNVVLVSPYQDMDFGHSRYNKIHLQNYPSLKLLKLAADDYANRDDTVVFIGAQHVNNGSMLLLDIIKLMKRRHPGLKFILVDMFSSSKFKEMFMDGVRKYRLNQVIKLVPKVRSDKIMTILNRATIGISPNLRVKQQIKGIHTKIYEYMAAGLPVVASDLPQQVEVIQNNEAGLLAQPENPMSFVKAIETLLENRVLAKKLGSNGQRQFKRKYSWEALMPRLNNYYDKIIRKT